MGTVYLARDLALGRLAALKLLSDELDSGQREWLVAEGRESARLQHPAIATFYEAGESSGRTFLAMEYVRGQTLKRRLERGPLPPLEAISIVADLLAALGHAHFAGILHRDVKPGNVMLTADRGAKLLDFGLAKQVGTPELGRLPGRAASGVDLQTLTLLAEEGAIVGTPGYMSPEQVSGTALDVRSDLFAIGAVLSEALTGRAAFPGATAAERLVAVLEPGPQPAEFDALMPGLGVVLAKALARDRESRYATAAQFMAGLEQLDGGAAGKRSDPSVAVLDLRNRSKLSGDDWIERGLADSLAESLGRVSGISVVPRMEVLRASTSGRDEDPDRGAIELGYRLGCRMALTGEFEREGDLVRVAMRLLDVATERCVASAEDRDTLEHLFDLRDRLCVQLVPHMSAGGPPTPLANCLLGATPAAPRVEAYEWHIRAERLRFSLQKGASDQARDFYERAVQLDPTFAPPLAGLAWLNAFLYTHTGSVRDLETGADYARRAIQLDPHSAVACVSLGYALWRLGNPEEGYAWAAQAMERGDPWAFYFGGTMLFEMGRLEGALRIEQRAVEVLPTHGYAWLCLGSLQVELGRLEEGAWCFRRAIEIERQGGVSPTPGAAIYLGECLRRLGRLEEARAECMAGIATAERSDHNHRDVFRGMGLLALGRTALDQADRDGACAAFNQAGEHARGRRQMSTGGHILVQALAGLARASLDEASFEKGLQIFDQRGDLDFGFGLLLRDGTTLHALAEAAHAVGREEQARELFERSRTVELRWRGLEG
jgi:eukaryotic-like serine/threonine-protein kinase